MCTVLGGEVRRREDRGGGGGQGARVARRTRYLHGPPTMLGNMTFVMNSIIMNNSLCRYTNTIITNPVLLFQKLLLFPQWVHDTTMAWFLAIIIVPHRLRRNGETPASLRNHHVSTILGFL